MFCTNSTKLVLPVAAITIALAAAPTATASNETPYAALDETATSPPTAPPAVPRRKFFPYIPKSPFSPLRSSTNTSSGEPPPSTQPLTAPSITTSEPVKQPASSNQGIQDSVNNPADTQTLERITQTESNSNTTAAPLKSILPLSTSPSVPAASDQQTYSVRLPLSTPGSILPKIYSPAPSAPPSSTFLPSAKQTQSTEYKPPVAWRATAEAIRNQPAGSGLIITTLSADFRTVYNSILQEAQISGWSVISDSVPAGHILLKIPRQGDQDDAAALLILVVSPLDAGSTEIRIKTQTKRPSAYAPSVNDFVQRLQLKASGNKLL